VLMHHTERQFVLRLSIPQTLLLRAAQVIE
jgi:hypothetical protein